MLEGKYLAGSGKYGAGERNRGDSQRLQMWKHPLEMTEKNMGGHVFLEEGKGKQKPKGRP